MTEFFEKAIKAYIDFERIRFTHEIEISRRVILEDFLFFVGLYKKNNAALSQVTESDVNKYHAYLIQSASCKDCETLIKIQTIREFLTFIRFQRINFNNESYE